MQTKAEEYRKQADDCDRRASESPDPEVQRQFKELAEQWRKMADEADWSHFRWT